MDKLQVAIVLPAEWVDCRDELGSPIMPTELRDALDEIEEAHSEFEIHGLLSGSSEEKASGIYPRLRIYKPGYIASYLPGFDRTVPGRPIGESLDKVRESGLPATIERVLEAYARKFHSV